MPTRTPMTSKGQHRPKKRNMRPKQGQTKAKTIIAERNPPPPIRTLEHNLLERNKNQLLMGYAQKHSLSVASL